jgi:hypothetical protein
MFESAPIPQEIISLIIERHLFNDASTLKACSLVSHSFLFPSQKCLFHTIHLDHDLRAQQHCQKLHHVFLDNPELLTYVRELYVMDYGSDGIWGRHPPAWSTQPWVSKEESLHAILKMLPLLRLFNFVFTDRIIAPKLWKSESVSVELKLALVAVFALPSLKTCMLKGVDGLPEEFFSTAKHLKKLSLAGISIARHPLGLSAPPVSSEKLQLESLGLIDVIDDGVLFEAMRASVDLSQLRDVSVFTELPDIVWEATKDSMGSLETLTWDCYAEYGQHSLMVHVIRFC